MDTGLLKSSWLLEFEKGSRKWAAIVGSEVYYAPYVEYGWTRSSGDRTWGYPGRKMLLGGWSAARHRMRKKMQDRLDRELEIALKKRGLI